jgi:hypothetical protein
MKTGLMHPKDRKICFIRFYPNPNSDRIRENLKYSKELVDKLNLQ